MEEVSFALFASHGRFRCDTGSPPRWWTVSVTAASNDDPAIAPLGLSRAPARRRLAAGCTRGNWTPSTPGKSKAAGG